MTIGTSVDWFPGSSTAGIEILIDADGNSIQDNALIGKKLLTIARNNELLTDFSGYPAFAFDAVTGTISGFPVYDGERIIITYTKP